MDKLFELSAELTLDAAAFLRGLAQAEQSARAATATMQRLQHTAFSGWQAVAQAVQTAADRMREYLALQVPSAPGASGAPAAKAADAPSPAAKAEAAAASTPAAASAPAAAPALTPVPKASGYATGIDYVPFNGFPARLHQGEAVLTALEASRWREAPAAPAPVDVSLLARAIAGALSGAMVEMDGQAVGQLVMPTVSREIARQAAMQY